MGARTHRTHQQISRLLSFPLVFCAAFKAGEVAEKTAGSLRLQRGSRKTGLRRYVIFHPRQLGGVGRRGWGGRCYDATPRTETQRCNLNCSPLCDGAAAAGAAATVSASQARLLQWPCCETERLWIVALACGSSSTADFLVGKYSEGHCPLVVRCRADTP